MPDASPGSGYAKSFESAMRNALQLAAETSSASAVGQDVPVGALVLDADGAISGRGRNQCLATGDPTAHAEIVAIRQAAEAMGTWRLDGCTLIATLEPCTMCAGAVRNARIRRLVYGAADPRAGAAGSLWDIAHDRRLGPPVEVIGGVLAAECAALITGFFERRRAESRQPRQGPA